jgi:hypothetical protein
VGAPPAIQALNAQPFPTGQLGFDSSSGAQYDVDVTGGEYSVWVRVFVPSSFGPDLGGPLSDSAWLAIDDEPPLLIGDDMADYDTWTWVQASPVTIQPGPHRVTLKVRERGFAIDQMILTRDPTFIPR